MPRNALRQTLLTLGVPFWIAAVLLTVLSIALAEVFASVASIVVYPTARGRLVAWWGRVMKKFQIARSSYDKKRQLRQKAVENGNGEAYNRGDRAARSSIAQCLGLEPDRILPDGTPVWQYPSIQKEIARLRRGAKTFEMPLTRDGERVRPGERYYAVWKRSGRGKFRVRFHDWRNDGTPEWIGMVPPGKYKTFSDDRIFVFADGEAADAMREGGRDA